MNKSKDNSNGIINSSIIILVLLLILSLVILFVRLAIQLPHTDDTFVICPKFDTVEVGDNKQIWDLDTDVTIFKTSKVDENGNVVVESIHGDKIIAPGMEGNYRFEIRNSSKFAVDTKTIVTAQLTVNGEVLENTPIEVRFSDYKGENVTEGGWVNVNNIGEFIDELTIGKKCYVFFNLDWRWVFEGTNDELDTLLGNLSCDNEVEFTINIVSSATRCGDKNAEGGLPLVNVYTPSGELDIIPLIAANVIVLFVIIVLLIIENHRRKNRKEKYKIASKE